MKWFKHDTDATNDPKIRKLKKQFGMEGYGLYFNLLELIARDMEDRPDDFGFLPKDWDHEALEMETGISSDKLRTITDFMCEIGLFCLKDKRLYNSKIIERCDDYTSRILRNKAQNTKSTNIVRTKSDKVPLDKIRIDKNISSEPSSDLEYVPLEEKKSMVPFESDAYILGLKNARRKDIQLVGKYMTIKKMKFPSLKAAKAEFGRNIKAAGDLAEYSEEKRKLAVSRAAKMTPQWTLQTVCKYINK